MATTDDRIVSMSFENSKFESGVHSTLSLLDKLKKSLQFPNAGKGLEGINAAANRTDLSHISRGIDTLSNKFTALRVTGLAVMASIATRAVAAGTQFVKSFTFQPVMDGLHEYQTNLNSVQTILANTQASGAKLKDVNKALNELNRYSDKTIYNFSEMAKNIGTFTAAGVDLKTSTKAIKGIANLAALSGSNSQQASTAMYQLSQAIAAGRVSLQDWNSVVNAGMGGTVFQRALAQTAEKMGTLDSGAVKLTGKMKNVSIAGQSFRESIQAGPGKKSWLTSDVLTKTLAHFTGDLTDAQLKAEGFNAAEIKAIQQQAKTAQNAATQVKTLGQVFDVAKETMGSGWAQTFQTIFGDFGEAKTTFTALSNAINGFINTNANARNKVLADWKALGGRAILIKGIKQAFHDLVDVVKPIKEAFRDIFPAKTGKDLLGFTKSFERLTERLKPSPQTVENLRRTFRGLFAVLDIGKQIVGGIFSVIGKLFGAVGDGSGGFLELTGNVGDWLVNLDKAIKKGNVLTNFFDTLGKVLATPIELLSKLGNAISGAFSASKIKVMGQSVSPLQIIIEDIEHAWSKFVESVSGAPNVFKPALEGISQMFGGLGSSIAEALKGANFDAVFKVLEVGLLGGIFLTLKKALSGGLGNALAGGVLKSVVQAFTGVGGLTRSIGGTFNALTGSIQTMQQNVKSDTLKNIAISIALLSASIVGLSLVDPKRLNSALSAITIGFGQLLGAMAIMDKIGKSGGFIKMPVIAASMVILAAAIDLLAIAVYSLSKLSWEQLAKGLGAVSVLLIGISSSAGTLSASSAGLIRAGVGITIIAVAMNILAKAVQAFGGMNMATLAKGIGGIAVALAGIGAAANLFPSGMIAIGVGLIAVGAGLKIIAGSVERLGNMNMATLAKGIGAIGIALAAIGLAMQLMPGPSMVITAAGLLLVSVALKGIAKAVGSFGSMSITELAKGLGALSAALLILTVGLMAMSGTLAGSAALAVAAAAIAVLAPALKSLGAQSWGQIIKGLVALAAAFALLGVAGLVLAPVAPAILALGAALIAVGAGLALAGAGVALIGIGLAAIAVAGPAAVKILVDALVKLAEALPKVVGNLVKALLQLVNSVADAAPKFVQALGKILVAMANAIIAAAPQLTKAITAILQLIFKVLQDNFPGLVKTGFDMLKALLKGISNNIGQVVKMVVNIVGKFLGAIASNLGKIVAGGASILIAIIKGIANNIGKVATAAASIVTKFLGAIGSGLGKIAVAGLSILTKLLSAIANNIGRAITAGTNVIVKFIQGIGNAGPRIITAGVNAITKFINAIARGAVRMADEGAKAIIRFLNGVADVIEKREPEIFAAGARIGKALVNGMVNGLTGLAGKLKGKITGALGGLGGKIKSFFSVAQPDMISIGQSLIDNIAKGINDKVPGILITARNLALIINKTVSDTIVANMPVIKDLGANLGNEFFTGILGIVTETSQVDTAFKALGDTISGDIKDVQGKIKTDSDNLAKALADGNGKLYLSSRESLQKHAALLQTLLEAQTFVTKGMTDEKNKLKDLVGAFGEVTKQLDDAKSALADLITERDNFVKGKFDQFSALPDIVGTDANGNPIDPATQVNNYTDALGTSSDAVTKFTSTLDQLRGMGLNDDVYKQLLDLGPAAQGFADALLAAGPAAIKAINDADAGLQKAAKIMADHAGSALYDVGINAGESLVKSLDDQKSKIYQKMVEIATLMIKAIKKKLHMKSPSKVFAELGRFTTEGLAQGITDSSKAVVDAVGSVSDDAISALKKSMSGISDAVTAHIDTNPTITPVLDLTQVQKDAKSMGSMLNVVPITAAASFGQASSISSAQDVATALKDSITDPAPIQFIQNNISPESLSDIEIYRQTKNQLAQARPVLTSP